MVSVYFSVVIINGAVDYSERLVSKVMRMLNCARFQFARSLWHCRNLFWLIGWLTDSVLLKPATSQWLWQWILTKVTWIQFLLRPTCILATVGYRESTWSQSVQCSTTAFKHHLKSHFCVFASNLLPAEFCYWSFRPSISPCLCAWWRSLA